MGSSVHQFITFNFSQAHLLIVVVVLLETQVFNRGKIQAYFFMQTCICVCVSGLSPAPHIPITAPSVCHTFVWWLFTAGRAYATGENSAFDSLYAEHMWDRTWSSPAEKTWPPKVTLVFITSHQSLTGPHLYSQHFPFNHNLHPSVLRP